MVEVGYGATASIVASLALASGCSSFTPADDTVAPVADAGSAADARSEARSDAQAPCAPGGPLAPTRAFDATPDPREAIGPACGVEQVLNEDGLVAGLDRAGNTVGRLQGHDVQGCVGVEFSFPISTIRIVASPKSDACGVRACDNDAGGCGKGRQFAVFAGSSERDLALLLTKPEMTADVLAPYVLPLSDRSDVRVVVVCRLTTSAANDDVGVDFIGATCR
jgi:hypothetical protein